MNFIKQLIFYTYFISSNEEATAMGIQAIHCDNNDIAWWNFTRYQDYFISKTKIQVATVYKNMKLCHNKEIIRIAQKNHNSNQYELKIILKTPSIYATFNSPSWWNVTYRFIVL